MTNIEGQINLEELLDGITFPTSKVEIIEYAEDQGASEEALEYFRAMRFKNYNNMQDINAVLGLIENQPGSENIWSSRRA